VYVCMCKRRRICVYVKDKDQCIYCVTDMYMCRCKGVYVYIYVQVYMCICKG